jgi:hypothetical protein
VLAATTVMLPQLMELLLLLLLLLLLQVSCS